MSIESSELSTERTVEATAKAGGTNCIFCRVISLESRIKISEPGDCKSE